MTSTWNSAQMAREYGRNGARATHAKRRVLVYVDGIAHTHESLGALLEITAEAARRRVARLRKAGLSVTMLALRAGMYGYGTRAK